MTNELILVLDALEIWLVHLRTNISSDDVIRRSSTIKMKKNPDRYTRSFLTFAEMEAPRAIM
jgi:hypothetical protein